MDSQAGIGDAIARQKILEQWETYGHAACNTSAALATNNVIEYIRYCVANIQRSLYQQSNLVQIGAFAPTGSANVLITEMRPGDSTQGLRMKTPSEDLFQAAVIAGNLASKNRAGYRTPRNHSRNAIHRHRVFVRKPWDSTENPALAVVSPAKMVEVVRSAFRLTVSDASKVLQVSRPTVYQWESLTDIEAIRAFNDRDRLKKLYQIALRWAARPPLRGRWLHAPLSSGSVFDLLSDTKIDEGALNHAYDELSAMASRLQDDEHQRVVDAVEAMKGAFEKLAANEKKRARKG
jgi:DNA-binding transcriptional regulator YiaG